MEATHRGTDSDLIQKLLREPHRYSFFQAVQLLEKSRGATTRVGHLGPAGEEVLRFRPKLSLAFPRADTDSITSSEGEGEDPRYMLETTFLGLYGTMSPLPNYYTEDLFNELERSPVRGFLDTFHHRLISLFYRCWEKYRFYLQYRLHGEDPFSRRMHAFLGLGITDTQSEVIVDRDQLTRYAGLLNQKPRSATALCRLVSDYFDGLRARVTSWIARCVEIPSDLVCSLGRANSRLGQEFYLGERILDRSGKFRITLGPMGLEQYRRFLPGRRDFQAVREIIGYFNPDRLEYEVELLLQQDQVPQTILHAGAAPRLGMTTWLGSPGTDGSVVIRGDHDPFQSVEEPLTAAAAL